MEVEACRANSMTVLRKNMAPIDIMNLSFVHCGSGGGRQALTDMMHILMQSRKKHHANTCVFQSMPSNKQNDFLCSKTWHIYVLSRNIHKIPQER